MTREQEARMELVESAKASRQREFHEWQDCIAPQWALDSVSQRELNAIYGLYWEPRLPRRRP